MTAYIPDIDTFYSWMTVRQAIDSESSMFEDLVIEDAMDLVQELKLDPDNKISSLSRDSEAG